MKYITVSAFLVILFIGVFVIHIERIPAGPISYTESGDDLGISEAYFNPRSGELYLIRKNSWTSINLMDISVANKEFQYEIIPNKRNFLHYKSFTAGRPSNEILAGLQPVDVLVNQFASFEYKYNGEAWHDHEHRVKLPDGTDYALYRSSSTRARNNRDCFRSYLFYSDSLWPDSRRGVQFYYHPDYAFRFSRQSSELLVIFGPSYLALLIALFTMAAVYRTWITPVLFILATVFHGASSALLAIVESFWGGTGKVYYPMYFIIGITTLAVLFIAKLFVSLAAKKT